MVATSQHYNRNDHFLCGAFYPTTIFTYYVEIITANTSECREGGGSNCPYQEVGKYQ